MYVERSAARSDPEQQDQSVSQNGATTTLTNSQNSSSVQFSKADRFPCVDDILDRLTRKTKLA